MDVFISWSGPRSRAIAEALRDWLPMVINALKPFLSNNDIDKGARWASEIAEKLESAKAGIICLTPSNMHADWILFEAGALSKIINRSLVCPLLCGLDPSDLGFPLAQFQATRMDEAEILDLLKTLNKGLGDAALPVDQIEKVFKLLWPSLNRKLKDLPAEDTPGNPKRTERELLEDVLALLKAQNQSGAIASISGDVVSTAQRTFLSQGYVLDQTLITPEGYAFRIRNASSGKSRLIRIQQCQNAPELIGSLLESIKRSDTLSSLNTVTIVRSSSNPSTVGHPVTFTATVSVVAPGTGTASGIVTFLDGGNPIGAGRLIDGIASFSTSALAAGNHTITTRYGGDDDCSGSSGSLNGNPQVVNQPQ